MAVRKRLGHSPLGYSMLGNSNFDFIPDRNPKPRPVPLEKEVTVEETPPKKIASYYLDEEILKDLKLYSKVNKQSYSSVVEDSIRLYLRTAGWL